MRLRRGAAAVAVAASLISCAAPRAVSRARVAILCSDGEAELTVDGTPYGLAKDYASGHRLLLTPGLHELVFHGHGSTETRSLTVGPEDDLTLTIALGPALEAAKFKEHLK